MGWAKTDDYYMVRGINVKAEKAFPVLFVPHIAGPRHECKAPGLAEGESAAVFRMLLRDQRAAVD